MPTEPTWTPRENPVNDGLYSSQIQPPDKRYYPYSSNILPGDKWYYIYQENWDTADWTPRS